MTILFDFISNWFFAPHPCPPGKRCHLEGDGEIILDNECSIMQYATSYIHRRQYNMSHIS